MSGAALSRETGIPHSQLADIVESRRDITPDIALRLADHFGTSARFWLNRQAAYERMRRRGPLTTAEPRAPPEPTPPPFPAHAQTGQPLGPVPPAHPEGGDPGPGNRPRPGPITGP